ncbi:uncharacterized protein G2W53_039165 [Senna tora]|uniref:Uncharacterized protein n=1 Tax=Senna tora TaxID=362788 RepID=A0A834W7P8_9FABA|nr:uncharacterized protein G2W53_039165 [Senna tora]
MTKEPTDATLTIAKASTTQNSKATCPGFAWPQNLGTNDRYWSKCTTEVTRPTLGLPSQLW